MIQIKETTENAPRLCQAIETLLSDLSSKPRHFGEPQLQEIISNPNSHLFLAYTADNATPIGMYTLAATHLPTGTRVWLEDVVVSHQAQGQGLGRHLVEHAICQARALYPGAPLMLTSRPSRLAANHIYQTLFHTKETNVYIL